ncbi:MAG: hypothetical protein ACI837_002903, partial [Crocinitomicaceae bacterium]
MKFFFYVSTLLTFLVFSSVTLAQVAKTNSTQGTVGLGPTHISRTFTYTPAEFGGCTSLTEVEMDLRLSVGNGTPCTAASYGVNEDLNVRLVSPTGTTVDLVQDRWGYWTGGLQPFTFNAFGFGESTVNFDDDHVTNITSLSSWPASDGNYAPHNPLSAFDGEDPTGTWTVHISDGNPQFAASDFFCYLTGTLIVTCGAPCTNPDVPTITPTLAIITCGGSTTLDWAPANLNSATNWHVYTGGCGTTQLTFQPGTSLIVSPTVTTTYNIRGEDGAGCVDESTGLCGSVTITVNPIVVTFTALADLCVDAGVQLALGSGSPAGGVYSGLGVTDDGNGLTYSFDPAAAGVGVHTITYTIGGPCPGSANDNVEVFGLPVVTFTALADLCIDAGVQLALGSGLATGGVYSGLGVTDDGNGLTYSFNPAAAGAGIHTITYTFTDANGCSGSANDNVEVFGLPVVTFTALADLCIDAGVQIALGSGLATGGVYSGL